MPIDLGAAGEVLVGVGAGGGRGGRVVGSSCRWERLYERRAGGRSWELERSRKMEGVTCKLELWSVIHSAQQGPS